MKPLIKIKKLAATSCNSMFKSTLNIFLLHKAPNFCDFSFISWAYQSLPWSPFMGIQTKVWGVWNTKDPVRKSPDSSRRVRQSPGKTGKMTKPLNLWVFRQLWTPFWECSRCVTEMIYTSKELYNPPLQEYEIIFQRNVLQIYWQSVKHQLNLTILAQFLLRKSSHFKVKINLWFITPENDPSDSFM